MLYELSLFIIALIGSAIGGWIDLKTTEIPDTVPLSMAGLGMLLHIANALFTGTWTSVYYAVLVGAAFLIFGYVLYYAGQWGEADVLLLVAVGVVLPVEPEFFGGTLFGPFPAVYFLNTFVVGGIYSMIYSVILAIRNRQVFPLFLKELKGGAKTFAALFLGFFLIWALAFLVLAKFFAIGLPPMLMLYNFLILLPAVGIVFAFYKFAQAVDMVAFRKKISTRRLREGDVLAEDAAGFRSRLYVGLEAGQIKKIQRAKKEVWIKEGVRYGPVFFLALVATWLWGNLLVLLLRII